MEDWPSKSETPWNMFTKKKDWVTYLGKPRCQHKSTIQILWGFFLCAPWSRDPETGSRIVHRPGFNWSSRRRTWRAFPFKIAIVMWCSNVSKTRYRPRLLDKSEVPSRSFSVFRRRTHLWRSLNSSMAFVLLKVLDHRNLIDRRLDLHPHEVLQTKWRSRLCRRGCS